MSESASDAAAFQETALHLRDISGEVVVGAGMQTPMIRPEGIGNLDHIVEGIADAVLEQFIESEA